MSEKWAYNDGGRARAGLSGSTGDCVARAIAIATNMPYEIVCDMIDKAAQAESRKRKSQSQKGVFPPTTRALLVALGWEYVELRYTGKRTFLRASQLPAGTLIISIVDHVTVMIDGVIHDSWDCSLGGNRHVRGYWQKKTLG